MFNDTTQRLDFPLFHKFECGRIVEEKKLVPYSISNSEVEWKETMDKVLCSGYYLPIYLNNNLTWECYKCGNKVPKEIT